MTRRTKGLLLRLFTARLQLKINSNIRCHHWLISWLIDWLIYRHLSSSSSRCWCVLFHKLRYLTKKSEERKLNKSNNYHKLIYYTVYYILIHTCPPLSYPIRKKNIISPPIVLRILIHYYILSWRYSLLLCMYSWLIKQLLYIIIKGFFETTEEWMNYL